MSLEEEKQGPEDGKCVPGAQGGASRAVRGESGVGGVMCSFSVQDIDGLLIQGMGEGRMQEVLYSGLAGGVGDPGAMGQGGKGGPGREVGEDLCERRWGWRKWWGDSLWRERGH